MKMTVTGKLDGEPFEPIQLQRVSGLTETDIWFEILDSVAAKLCPDRMGDTEMPDVPRGPDQNRVITPAKRAAALGLSNVEYVDAQDETQHCPA